MADGNPALSVPSPNRRSLHLTIANHHHESLALHITKLQTHPIILGIDWLHPHNPAINWKRHLVFSRISFCNKNCFEQCPVLPLETLLSDLDLETLEPSVNDYYLCQLISELCDEPSPALYLLCS